MAWQQTEAITGGQARYAGQHLMTGIALLALESWLQQSTQYLCLFTLWCNGVNLINEDDGRCILLCLLKSLPQIAFRLSC